MARLRTKSLLDPFFVSIVHIAIVQWVVFDNQAQLARLVRVLGVVV